jgi:uncharacterized protein (TIGR00661 family)
MKILYGVTGEGMGHAIRSRVVLEHLVQHHQIEVVTSGRAVAFLEKRFSGVRAIHGLHMVYEDNRIRKGKTLWSNIERGARGLPGNVATYFNMLGSFAPDLVISDFESWTYLYAQAHRLPIISIDNMQIINRCKHKKAITAGHEGVFRLTKAFVKAKLPGCDHYVIATFFRPPVRKKNTTLVSPILRQEILEAPIERGGHLLVYQTGEGSETLLGTLAKTGIECRVYGARRGIESEQVEGNLRYQPFSEDKFISDLASARAVIAGGGFTLMGEAVFLKKPMLAVPLAGQFEQVLNGKYLEAEGYGMMAETLDDSAIVHRFLEQIDTYGAKLEHYHQDGNRELFDVLDGLIDRAASGLLG